MCEALGGVTDIERQQLHDIPGVDIQTKTTCKGGLLDGMTCTNTLIDGKTKCAMSFWQPVDGPHVPPTGGIYDGFVAPTDVDRILAGSEAGLSAEEILAGLDSPTPGGQDMLPHDDQGSDTHEDKGKGKKSKHGKKRGKGRNR